MPQLFTEIVDDARVWRRGQERWWRVPFLVYFAYVLVRHLGDPMYSSWLAQLNLGIHEAGHVLTRPFGELVSVCSGTGFQLFVPVYGVYNFVKQRDYFSAALSWGWLGTNLFNVSTYMADARTMRLPLVTPFGVHGIHDWNYLLARTGLLPYDTTLAFAVQLAAAATMFFCLYAGGWLVSGMTGEGSSMEEPR